MKRCFRSKNVSEFVGKHFCFLGSKFVSATLFPVVGKQGNIDREHNVSETVFPGLPSALVIIVKSLNQKIVTGGDKLGHPFYN